MSETPNPERDRRDPYGEPGPGHYDDRPRRDDGLSEDARRDAPREAPAHTDHRYDEPRRDDVRR
ncbi:MAG: hypothetical protein Q4F53_10670, partial [Nesterenkonia sp.]|nr:hypothetical protein [Nesterenkonia sp.]